MPNKTMPNKKEIFKEGDLIRIRPLTKDTRTTVGIVDGMLKYAGLMARVVSTDNDDHKFKINIDKGKYWWDGNCATHIIHSPKPKNEITLKELSPQDKKIIKEKVESIIKNRKRQLNAIEKSIMTPIERDIRLAERALDNTYPIDKFIENSLLLSEHIENILSPRLNTENLEIEPPKQPTK